ncbi:MAG: hypothetical protein LUI12_12810 [Clostridiales bacterium]|nr:hypothetical protein [Clostridiales bacterium]
MAKFKAGDAVFIIESNRIIREATVLKSGGGFYTIRFADSGGGIKVRENRLYATKEDAQTQLTSSSLNSQKHRTPYDFM